MHLPNFPGCAGCVQDGLPERRWLAALAQSVAWQFFGNWLVDSFNFTLERLSQIKCPPDKPRIRCLDTKVRGLMFRVNRGGSKIYGWYRRLPDDNESPRKQCEITIGAFEDVPLEEARKRAEEFNVIVGDKKDPSLTREAGITYGALFNRYLEEYAKTRTTTWQSAVYNHERYFKRWHHRLVADIDTQSIQRWVNDMGAEYGKHTANRTFNTMRAVLSWALRKELIAGQNACHGVDTFKVQARERFILPGDEFQKFADALNQEPNATIRDFFWMCLFTGARRANVLEMEWNQIDFELLSWRIPVTKNNESLTVPLTSSSIEILRRRFSDPLRHDRWVFPSDRTGRKTGELGHLSSPHKAWARIIQRAGIADLRIHDLRRTAGSYMAINGVSPTIIGKALGHKSLQSTAIYARLTQDPVRRAFENAERRLNGDIIN
jgi:integrase